MFVCTVMLKMFSVCIVKLTTGQALKTQHSCNYYMKSFSGCIFELLFALSVA